MKITQELKDSPTFIFAKMKGCNNREAARFCSILSEGINEKRCDGKAVDIYVRISKEPKVNVLAYDYEYVKDGLQKKSRSKLVMEYEKHRKAFLKIKEARQADGLVDALLSENYEEFSKSENVRYAVLASIVSKLSQ